MVDEMVQSGRPAFVLAIIGCVASLALIVTALWLPWATLQEGTSGVTRFAAGSLAGWLMALALFTIALSPVALRWPSAWLKWAILGSSVCAFGLAVLLALRSISSANLVLNHTNSETSYAFGSVLGVLAGVAMTVTAVLSLREA